MEKAVILLNPMTLNDRLCVALKEAGITIFAFYTREELSASSGSGFHALDPTYFLLQECLSLDFDQDIAHLKEMMSGYALQACLPCCELHLDYTEEIAYALCPMHSNNPKTSALRYDKYSMGEQLKKMGLTYIPQCRVALNTQVQASDIEWLGFPVVVKPSVETGASKGVKICDNLAAVQDHMDVLRKSKGPAGRKIQADILVQRKIEGEEFFVDTVSANGNHFIVGIYHYTKVLHDGLLIYRYIEYVHQGTPEWQVCYQYIKKILDAFDVQYGFSHTEFMLTDDLEPYLIEINPRMSGLLGEVNRMVHKLTHQDQASMYQTLVTNNFDSNLLKEYFSKQYGRVFLIYSWIPKVYNGVNEALFGCFQASYFHCTPIQDIGENIDKPKSMLDTVVSMTLIDASEESLNSDTNMIFEWEASGEIFL